jgi:alpha-beta hydrolase superfamily lysophospholipase
MRTKTLSLMAFGWLLGCLSLSANASAPKNVLLHAKDGVAVYGTFTPAAKPGAKILLLFHQAGASRHEYDPLIPAFHQQGWDTLAIDQRSGGRLFGGRNETVAKLGKSVSYLEAMPDLEAALAWARARKYGTIVTVGSSYSSSLVLLLAAKHPQAVSAVVSFSPGEYFSSDRNMIKRAAARLHMPVYITTDPKEESNVDSVLRDAHGANVTRYRPSVGVHGASTLVCARDPAGCKANMASFLDFLRNLGENAHPSAPER